VRPDRHVVVIAVAVVITRLELELRHRQHAGVDAALRLDTDAVGADVGRYARRALDHLDHDGT